MRCFYHSLTLHETANATRTGSLATASYPGAFGPSSSMTRPPASRKAILGGPNPDQAATSLDLDRDGRR
jgi:hypothetical protein